MGWFELIGFAASTFVVGGLLMTSVLRLRLLGLVGAILFCAYAVLIGAVPVLVTNGAIVFVHVFHLRRILRDRSREEYFEVVPWRITGAYVPRFLRFWAEDVTRFQPDFGGLAANHRAFVVLRDVVPVGLVLYRELGDGVARIDLDYVTPAHRDQRAAHYVFDPAGPFAQLGISHLETTAVTDHHRRYLERVGFTEADGRYRLVLADRVAPGA
jgi:hypothetical protein